MFGIFLLQYLLAVHFVKFHNPHFALFCKYIILLALYYIFSLPGRTKGAYGYRMVSVPFVRHKPLFRIEGLLRFAFKIGRQVPQVIT